MRTLFLRSVYLCVLLGVLGTSAMAETIFDSFEGNSLAFWTKTGPGTAAFTKAAAHTGNQSLILTTAPESQDNRDHAYVSKLKHDFGRDRTGSVSIWFQSHLCPPGCPPLIGGQGDMQVIADNGDWANIQETSIEGIFQARLNFGGVEQPSLPFQAAPAAWHLFEIRADFRGVEILLDGVVVSTDPRLKGFRYVVIDTWGLPLIFGYFDDFQALLYQHNICPQYDWTKPKNAGATLPVKLEFCDSNGNNLSSPAVTVHVEAALQLPRLFPFLAVEDSGKANPGNNFRFDGGIYIFNLSTKGLGNGSYILGFTVSDDPLIYLVPFALK